MDKVIDITKIVAKTKDEKKTAAQLDKVQKAPKATNPIKSNALKKLASFTNEKLSKKFDINDLLR